MSKGSGQLQVGLSGRRGQVRDGSKIDSIKVYSASVNPASLAAATGAETDVTVTGVTTDDILLAVEPAAALNNGISYSARVKAANTVAIHFVNVTAGAIDVAATTFKFVVAKIPTANY